MILIFFILMRCYIFIKQFLTKVIIFHCRFDVYSVHPPQIFEVQAKISIVRPVFPDYLSVSYEYGVKKELFRILTLTATLWVPTSYRTEVYPLVVTNSRIHFPES